MLYASANSSKLSPDSHGREKQSGWSNLSSKCHPADFAAGLSTTAPFNDKIFQPASVLLYQTSPWPSIKPRHPTGEHAGSCDTTKSIHAASKTSSNDLCTREFFFGPLCNFPLTKEKILFRSFSFTSFCIFRPNARAPSGE